jgi:hypothetical protein
MEKKIPNFSPSNIETIDAAFLDFVEGLKLHCNTSSGWEPVPVIWSSAERAYQIKNNRKLRDESGTLIPPIISIERTTTAKDPTRKGSFVHSVTPGLDRYYYAAALNQNTTSKFANNDSVKNSGQINFVTSKKNKKQVYQYYSLPIPVYITVEYKINILTTYQSQMNEILQPFIARTGQNYFLINKDNHRYECFMDQNFTQDSIANLAEEERKFKTVVDVKVLGYLIGEGDNSEKSSYDIIENAVEFKFPKENLVLLEEGLEDKNAVKNFGNAGVLASSKIPVKKTYLIGNGIDDIYVVTHNMNSRDLFIQVRENFSPYSIVTVAIDYTELNYITITMDGPIGLNSYAVTILG